MGRYLHFFKNFLSVWGAGTEMNEKKKKKNVVISETPQGTTGNRTFFVSSVILVTCGRHARTNAFRRYSVGCTHFFPPPSVSKFFLKFFLFRNNAVIEQKFVSSESSSNLRVTHPFRPPPPVNRLRRTRHTEWLVLTPRRGRFVYFSFLLSQKQSDRARLF